MNPVFRPVLVVVTVLVLMLVLNARRNANIPDDHLPWRKDLDAAKREAVEANKPVLAYFTASWCDPCQAMKRQTWPDPRVATALQGVVPVKIDVDEQADVAKSFNLVGIPRLQLIGPDGTLGRSREGFVTADELVAFLRPG